MWKIVLLLEFPIKFDERFKNSNSNLLSCALNHFTFNLLHEIVLY